MAANTVNAYQVLQEKIAAANSTNISTRDLFFLVKSASLLTYGSTIESYANTSYFPDANTSATNVVFDETNGAIFLNVNNTWVGVEPIPEIPLQPFQGTNYGYASSGGKYPTPGSNIVLIDKFPFTSDSNATNIGNLTGKRFKASGQSSSEYGYASSATPSSDARASSIDKFSFASDGNASLRAGGLSIETTIDPVGHSSINYGYGYDSGLSNIQKFSFANDSESSISVGTYLTTLYSSAGQSSIEYGYSSGGYPPSGVTTIEKFPFSTDANSADVGDLTVARRGPTGQNSSDYGYTSGGRSGSTNQDVIDKFPFAADGNATDIGNLTLGRYGGSGTSSTDYGYTSGGSIPAAPFYATDTLDKFAFASDGNATDVGNLSEVRKNSSPQQY